MERYMIEIWESDDWSSRNYTEFNSDEDAVSHCQKVANRTGFPTSADRRSYLGGGWITVAFSEPEEPAEKRGFIPCLGVISTCLSNEEHHGIVCDNCGSCNECCEC